MTAKPDNQFDNLRSWEEGGDNTTFAELVRG